MREWSCPCARLLSYAPSDAGDEAAGVQDVARIELRLDALHDAAGGAGIVPYRDLRLHRERRPFEIRVAAPGARHLAPLGEHRGERRRIFQSRVGRERTEIGRASCRERVEIVEDAAGSK